MNKNQGNPISRIDADSDYTHITVSVRGGCVQGARLDDGREISITVHDYDVHDDDIREANHDIDRDEKGRHYERLIA